MPVTFTVCSIQPVRSAGRLIALAIVVLEFAGVELVLQGVQVIRVVGDIEVRPPVWRHPATGRLVPAVILHPELGAAISAEVLGMMEAAQDPRHMLSEPR